MSYSKERTAYLEHDFIRRCIDLNASGIAFGSGSFFTYKDSLPKDIDWTISEEQLTNIITDLLIDARAHARLIITQDNVDIERVDIEDEPSSDNLVLDFNFKRSSDDTEPQSPLSFALVNYEKFQEFSELLSTNPTLAKYCGDLKKQIFQSLRIPHYMLDQNSINKTPPVKLNYDLWYFPFEVVPIRHTIRYTMINEAIPHIEDLSDGLDLHWDWNIDLSERGMCRFGPTYQVFRKHGLDLEKLRKYEIEPLRQLVDNGLVSKKTLSDCISSYEK